MTSAGDHAAGRSPARRPCVRSSVPRDVVDRDLAERGRNHAVVVGRVRDRATRQVEPERERRPAIAVDRRDHAVIVGGIDDHEHVAEVLGGRAHEARPTDVDLLDEVVHRQFRLRRRLRERVEVDDDEIDERDAVLRDRREVVRAPAPGQDAAVDLRVQGLDAAVDHFRESP